MQAGFDGSNSRRGYAGDFFERIIFDKVQQQHGTLRQWQLIQQLHELSLLFAANKQLARVILDLQRRPGNFFKSVPFTTLSSPALNAFLVRDAEEPTAEFPIIAQRADVPDGVDERLLDDIEAGLRVMDHSKT